MIGNLEADADLSARRGGAFAAYITRLAHEEQLDTPALITALAYVFAAVLVNADGHITVYEAAGLGLVGDDERINQHAELIRELIAEMRKQRASERTADPVN